MHQRPLSADRPREWPEGPDVDLGRERRGHVGGQRRLTTGLQPRSCRRPPGECRRRSSHERGEQPRLRRRRALRHARSGVQPAAGRWRTANLAPRGRSERRGSDDHRGATFRWVRAPRHGQLGRVLVGAKWEELAEHPSRGWRTGEAPLRSHGGRNRGRRHARVVDGPEAQQHLENAEGRRGTRAVHRGRAVSGPWAGW